MSAKSRPGGTPSNVHRHQDILGLRSVWRVGRVRLGFHLGFDDAPQHWCRVMITAIMDGMTILIFIYIAIEVGKNK